ncbi:MAG: hypothetical protein IPM35_20360 [Myxococcales bacterium]|nr:hypothetical protein [Myxococcales bacterium]
MPAYITTYAALETARASLSAALSGEAPSDKTQGRLLLEEVDQARAGYAALAATNNQAADLAAALTNAYSAAVTAHNSFATSLWSGLDASARAAEAALVALGAPGSWAPATPTSPANDVPAVAARARVAADACMAYANLIDVARALYRGADDITYHAAHPPVAPQVPSHAQPSTTGLDPLVERVNKFLAYLAAS